MVKHKFGSSISGRVLAQEGPRVGINVIAVEVTFQGLAVSDRGVQITAQSIDLPPLRVDAHLVARARTGAVLKEIHHNFIVLTSYTTHSENRTIESAFHYTILSF